MMSRSPLARRSSVNVTVGTAIDSQLQEATVAGEGYRRAAERECLTTIVHVLGFHLTPTVPPRRRGRHATSHGATPHMAARPASRRTAVVSPPEAPPRPAVRDFTGGAVGH